MMEYRDGSKKAHAGILQKLQPCNADKLQFRCIDPSYTDELVEIALFREEHDFAAVVAAEP